MPADLQIDPDAVDGLARLAARVADELAGAAPHAVDVSAAVSELLAFATAARRAATRARAADRDAAAGFR